MFGIDLRKGSIISPRAILSLTLVLGMLSGQGGRGTLAFFTSSVVSEPNTFSGGVVDIAGVLTGTGSDASILSTTAFGWNTAAGGTNCANVLTGTDITTQRMAPGHYCVAPIDINNNNANSIDAWIRLRLVRATAAGSAATAEENAALEMLNDRLRIYISEYTGGTATVTAGSLGTIGTAGYFTNTQAANKAARDANCTTANFKPNSSKSTATIANGAVADGTGATVGGATINWTGVTRTALTSLGPGGKNIGAHPGISAIGGTQDTAVVALVDKSDEDTVQSGTIPASANGLRIRNGTASSAAPSEANMVTALSTRNAFNIIGNDEVTNPIQVGTPTAVNGTEPQGNNTEATLAKGDRRFFCAAIFFPSDTDVTFSTVYASDGGNKTVPNEAYGTTTSGQWINCTGNPAGCASLGAGTSAITAANSKGDNAAQVGSVTYYLTVTAAQKAGRTVN